MPVRQNHTGGLTWFITFTGFEWLNLFEITNSYDLVYKWFGYLKDNDLADIVAYVIMPNHFHAIVHLNGADRNLNAIVANRRRFMAYEIVERLKRGKGDEILLRLQEGLNDTDRKKGQKHRVFETFFDAKAIMMDKFLFQKLRYIYLNPVSGKWNLARDFALYEHSSAPFYEFGAAKYFTPRHYSEVWIND